MDITFSCSKCGQSLTIDQAGARLSIECPKCGQQLTVPGPTKERAAPSDAGSCSTSGAFVVSPRYFAEIIRAAHSSQPAETEQCPFCAETIKAEAKVCRFCGRDVVAGQPATRTADAATAKASSPALEILPALVFIALIVGGGILAFCLYQYENSDAAYWRNLRGVAYQRSERASAEAGDAQAQGSLGFDYEHGYEGLAIDCGEAAKWYRKAAEQGNASAQYQLAELYWDGRGVLQDYAEADKWYRKAVESYRKKAEAGDADAQVQLGFAYDLGKGVTKDDVQAWRWFRTAADQGDATAQENVGECYENGRGIEKDVIEAYKWYNLASVNDKYLAPSKRDALAEAMTPEQIAEGQRRATQFMAERKTGSH